MYEYLANYYDALMAVDVDYHHWVDYIIQLWAESGKTGMLSIYDTACGTGNISLELAKQQHHVVASDFSQEMLEYAQEKRYKEAVSIQYLYQDLRHLSLHKPVDIVNCSCDGVNYLLTEQDVKAFFESAYDCLNSNGLLSFDISSAYKLQCILGDNTFIEDTDDLMYIWQNEYDVNKKQVMMDITFFLQTDAIDVYKRCDEEHIQQAHSLKLLTHWLQESGFHHIKTYADFTLNSPTSETERVFFIAQK